MTTRVVTWLGDIEFDIRVNGQPLPEGAHVEFVREYGKLYRVEITVPAAPPQRHWAQGDS